MKKFLVIGSPIKHSLSPQLHNYWIKQNNIDAVYDKQELDSGDLENLILKIKNREISGANVTVPFKKEVISYLDHLSDGAAKTQSVNTINLENGKIVGHNTDIEGFEFAIQDTKFNITNKEIFILGAGGVVPSIIFALKKMGVNKIVVSNRTKKKAEDLKKFFLDVEIIDWGKNIDFDMIINTTSLGLKNEDQIKLDFSKTGSNKLFYDVIYNPSETNFLKEGRKLGNKVENGKLMFLYQAFEAFKLWHGIEPQINENIMRLLQND